MDFRFTYNVLNIFLISYAIYIECQDISMYICCESFWLKFSFNGLDVHETSDLLVLFYHALYISSNHNGSYHVHMLFIYLLNKEYTFRFKLSQQMNEPVSTLCNFLYLQRQINSENSDVDLNSPAIVTQTPKTPKTNYSMTNIITKTPQMSCKTPSADIKTPQRSILRQNSSCSSSVKKRRVAFMSESKQFNSDSDSDSSTSELMEVEVCMSILVEALE